MNEAHLKQIDEETTCPGQMSPIILQLYCTYIFRKLNMNIKKENVSKATEDNDSVITPKPL